MMSTHAWFKSEDLHPSSYLELCIRPVCSSTVTCLDMLYGCEVVKDMQSWGNQLTWLAPTPTPGQVIKEQDGVPCMQGREGNGLC